MKESTPLFRKSNFFAIPVALCITMSIAGRCWTATAPVPDPASGVVVNQQEKKAAEEKARAEKKVLEAKARAEERKVREEKKALEKAEKEAKAAKARQEKKALKEQKYREAAAKAASRQAQPANSPDRAARYVRSAENYYWAGDLASAQKMIDRALLADPQNEAAVNFRNKLQTLLKRGEEITRDMAEQYYYRGEAFFRRGEVLNALYWVHRAVEANPAALKATSLYATVFERANDGQIVNADDRHTCAKGVQSFLEGNYDKAADIFRGLADQYPEMNSYLTAATARFADDMNRTRSERYYRGALAAMKKRQYIGARDDLRMAIDMDRNNILARRALEQLNLELEVPRISVLGQD